MTDHPAALNQSSLAGADWDDHAVVHQIDDGGGLLDGLKGIHRGTLREMIALVAALPAEERAGLVIQKAGDRRIGPDEIMDLAAQPDFHAQG